MGCYLPSSHSLLPSHSPLSSVLFPSNQSSKQQSLQSVFQRVLSLGNVSCLPRSDETTESRTPLKSQNTKPTSLFFTIWSNYPVIYITCKMLTSSLSKSFVIQRDKYYIGIISEAVCIDFLSFEEVCIVLLPHGVVYSTFYDVHTNLIN